MSSVVLTEARDVTPSPAEPQGNTYWLTRFLLLRLLGIVYLAAFLSLAVQVLPLIGAHGLLPATTLAGRRRPRPRRRRLDRRRRLARRRPRRGERAHDGVPLGALPVVHLDRTGLVRLRLGDPARRDRLPRDLSLPAARSAAISAPLRIETPIPAEPPVNGP